MVEVGTDFAGDDWTTPAFLTELRERIARAATIGMTNTAYEG